MFVSVSVSFLFELIELNVEMIVLESFGDL